MRAILLALALMLAAGPLRGQWPLRVAPVLLIYEDWTQSMHTDGVERNPFLGVHPSDRTTTLACLVAVAVNLIPWRGQSWVNRVTLGAEFAVVAHNAFTRDVRGHRIGIRLWK